MYRQCREKQCILQKVLVFLTLMLFKAKQKIKIENMAFNDSFLTCHYWFSVVVCASSYLYLVSAGKDEYVFF